VYGLPGVGRIGLQALARRDLPVVMGVVLLVSPAIVVANMLVDLLYGWLDPRTATRSLRAAHREAAPPAQEASPAPLSVAPRSSV
nr:ABC transporter permease [Actinomycetota bacterium]